MGTTAIPIPNNALYAANLIMNTFPSSDWQMAVAICDAESTFTPTQANGIMLGLFQIDSQVWTPTLNLTQAQNYLFNAPNNVAMAWHVWQSPQGPSAWTNNDNYYDYMGYASQVIAAVQASRQTVSVPQVSSPRPVITASDFAVHGTASVTSGGRILGTLALHASGGGVSYRVTMSLSPSYNTSDPTANTVTGNIGSGQTVNVETALVAPIPSEEIIRSYQQEHSGPVTFPYTVSWTVQDAVTGRSLGISGGQRVTLTVQ